MADIATTAVLLCECHGRIDRNLLDEIRGFLHDTEPDLPVVVTDNLCDPEVLPRLVKEHGMSSVVLLACSQPTAALRFWEEPQSAAVDPFSIRSVDLLTESSLPLKHEDLLDRIKLLLLGQLRRQAHGIPVPEQAMAVRFDKPQGEISRRQMFTTLLPRHRVVPYVKTDECRGATKCRLCVDSCPLGAILVDDGKMVIDRAVCNGCGVCTVACPFQAIAYPTFSVNEVEAEIEGLLEDTTVLQPRIIAMVCQNSSVSRAEVRHVPNVLPLEIPCLGMASPWLLLRAIELGAQGLALVSDKQTCQLGIDPGQCHGNAAFVQGLLEKWGISPLRVAVIEESEPGQSLSDFAQLIAGMAPLRLTPSSGGRVDGMALPALVAGLTEQLVPCSDGVVRSGDVPFGKVEVDASQCTGCGLCVLHCATGAVHYPDSGDGVQLLFDHSLCVGCGECARICPEKCLTVEKVLELDRLNKPAQAVFGDEIVRCKACGGPVAPRAMLDKLRSRLEAAGAPTSQLDICPACRAKGRSGSSIMVGA